MRAHRDGGRALTTALLLRHTTGGSAEWLIIGPLLVAGLRGGMVTSPNVTLTLEDMPVRMAGAAGGTLQTVQRIGAAIGTATLATIFYHVLNQTAHDYQERCQTPCSARARSCSCRC